MQKQTKYTEEERSNRISELKAKHDSVAVKAIEHIPETDHLDHISEIPDGFSEGTVLKR